jgi:hypothetical protein
MTALGLEHFGPVKAKPDYPSAYSLLIDALEKLRGKLDDADDTRIGDLPGLLDEMAGLCDGAHGAALLLAAKCK